MMNMDTIVLLDCASTKISQQMPTVGIYLVKYKSLSEKRRRALYNGQPGQFIYGRVQF